ncbi:MAG: glycine cleavage system aminomethyltransferase GcvT [Candidatus Binatia bacterium]
MHRRLGARMVGFGGWEMPVQYGGILEEHRAVRSRAGIFDVSHMGEVEIRGARALEVVQGLLTNDAAKLRDGDAQYSVLCLPSAGIIDDVIYYRLAPNRYFFCVNASNQEKDFEWMRQQAQGAEVVNRSDEFAQIALQGPLAESILAPVTPLDVAKLPAFRAAETSVAGVPALVSRTGYTGEDGFEIYADPAKAEMLWGALLEAGSPKGLVPVGLGARDTLRLEKGLMLYGNDIDSTTTPFEAGLGWVVKLDKGEFIGRQALLRQQRDGVSRRLVGLEMRDGAIARHGYPILRDGKPTGTVTSGTKSPALGRGIALGYVETAASAVGTLLEIEIRGRLHPAAVVKLPFYRRITSQ